LPLLQKTLARGFASQTREGDYVIQLKGPYDIALNRSEQGVYDLTTDWWGGYVEQEVGPKFGRLLQIYGVHKATREAKLRGFSVLRRAKEDGSIKLILAGGVQ
jgi:hypothetical protein